MLDETKARNFSGYISQKNWKDSDPLVECTVECIIDGKPHKTVFMFIDPLEAIKEAQKNFNSLKWEEIK